MICATVLGIGLSFAALSPASARQKMPEVSHDGLHLVRGKGFAAFYLKPGATLTQYDRLVVLDCYVAFNKHWQRDQPEEMGRVSHKDMAKIKQHLAAEFHKVFVEELATKGGYQVVDKGGEDVMILRPAIVNLEIEAPDSMNTPDEMSFSASAGQMTLYLELYDSATSDIIARIIDPEAGQTSGMIQWRNEVTNSAEADRILKKWADVLRERLDEAHGKKGKK
jgi:hypothetical protein